MNDTVTTDLPTLLDLYEQGLLTGDQAMAVLLIDTGRRERSAQSKMIGHAVDAVAKGEWPIESLTGVLAALPPTRKEGEMVHKFNKGDRVRVVEPDHQWFGNVGTVVRTPSEEATPGLGLGPSRSYAVLFDGWQDPAAPFRDDGQGLPYVGTGFALIEAA